MNSDTNRLFLALEIPSTIKVKLLALQEPAKHIKWANVEQFHITVNFLGQTDTRAIERVVNIVRQKVSEFESIDLKLSAITVRDGNMIWLVVDDPSQKLTNLHQNLKKSFYTERIGEREVERTYSPHILLGKYRGGDVLFEDDDILVHIKQHLKVTPMTVQYIYLFKSVLEKQGTRHIMLEKIRFGQAGTARKSEDQIELIAQR